MSPTLLSPTCPILGMNGICNGWNVFHMEAGNGS